MSSDFAYLLMSREFMSSSAAQFDEGTLLTMYAFIAAANWKEGKFGQHTIKPGQMVCANRNLVERLYPNQGIAPSLNTLKKRINNLESVGCLVRKQISHRGRKVTIYTLPNYQHYQRRNAGRGSDFDPQPDPHLDPRADPRSDPRAGPDRINNNQKQLTTSNTNTASIRIDDAGDQQNHQSNGLFEGVPPEKPNPPKTPNTDELFARFWAVVHQKTGKQSALKSFSRALRRIQTDQGITREQATDFLVESMTEFASSPASRPTDHSPIHPSTWLNQGRYDDDRALWHKQPKPAKQSNRIGDRPKPNYGPKSRRFTPEELAARGRDPSGKLLDPDEGCGPITVRIDNSQPPETKNGTTSQLAKELSNVEGRKR